MSRVPIGVAIHQEGYPQLISVRSVARSPESAENEASYPVLQESGYRRKICLISILSEIASLHSLYQTQPPCQQSSN